MDKKMYWFILENKKSEPGAQYTFAKSELKYSLNMDTEMYWFLLLNKKSESGEAEHFRIIKT